MRRRDLHLQRLKVGLSQIPIFETRDPRERDPQFDAWRANMLNSLDIVLPDSDYSIQLANTRFQDFSGGYGDYIPDHRRHRIHGLHEAALLLQAAIEEAEFAEPTTAAVNAEPFVDPSRISALAATSPAGFDTQRLVRMCEEANICYRDGCYLAVAMLTRAILDHVPPLFGKTTFSEVANGYAGGRSFKSSMQHLEKSARHIADSHLHQHIRGREVLPAKTQVSFQHDMDVLLGEILRIR